MEFIQAKSIMEELYAVYPNFNRKGIEDFDKIWIKRLMKGDYKKTMRKVEEYTGTNPYPPSLADVLVKEYKPTPIAQMELPRATAEVERELADPEARKRREATLEKARQKRMEFQELMRSD
ncbi:hypothetical protein [Salinicoccus bachuensis]|uniref:Replicative helicase inhibitor G39P N-terminal domain-containing protein n=1 Tax=Salinicoccus bachuensis TaxID=3136731 RepID=A0ABZ3CI07_9STAP